MKELKIIKTLEELHKYSYSHECPCRYLEFFSIEQVQDLLHQQAQLSYEAGMKYAIEYIAKENAWEESEVYFKEQLLSPEEVKKSITLKKND